MHIHFAYDFNDAEAAARLFEPLAHFSRVIRIQTPLPNDGTASHTARALCHGDALVILWSETAAQSRDLRGIVALGVHNGLTVVVLPATPTAPEPPLGLPTMWIDRSRPDLTQPLARLVAELRRRRRDAPQVKLPETPKQPPRTMTGRRRHLRDTLMGPSARVA